MDFNSVYTPNTSDQPTVSENSQVQPQRDTSSPHSTASTFILEPLDEMPTNYCNSDLGQFFTGDRWGAFCQPLSTELNPKAKFDDYMAECKKRGKTVRYICELAAGQKLGHEIPEDVAEREFPGENQEWERNTYTQKMYEFLAAEDPEKALTLKSLNSAGRYCWNCTAPNFKGFGHLRGCARGEPESIDYFLGYAITDLGFPECESTKAVGDVMKEKYNRKGEDLVETAKLRAFQYKDDPEYTADLTDDPLRQVIARLTYVEHCRQIAREDAAKGMIKWIKYACTVNCLACIQGRPGQKAHMDITWGCLRPWEDIAYKGMEEACITLHIDRSRTIEEAVLLG